MLLKVYSPPIHPGGGKFAEWKTPIFVVKLKILAYFSWMCCVVTKFVDANTNILSILSE